MKKKIGILGSTGSIGTTLLKLIDPKKIEISFLLTNKNYKKLLNQAEKFNVKNLIIIDKQSYLLAKKFNKNSKLKIYNEFYNFKNIINNKLDYVMSSITGLAGLKHTYDVVKFTKKIAIANKETLICAWPLLKKELMKYKTEFIPIDSEHFSIWTEIKGIDNNKIKKIYLTASGGPLLKSNIKFFDKVKPLHVLKHPTWKMGKKISVDSATMMNKCFEVMEAKNIFDLNYDKIDILIHPDSYVHAIVSYNNGVSKMIIHDTTMEIPIFNSIYPDNELYKNLKCLNIKKMNNLKLSNIFIKRFPLIKLLKRLPKKHSLFETIIVSINDFLVDKFLNKKIKFTDISKIFLKLANSKKFLTYKKIQPKSINHIIFLHNQITKDLKTNFFLINNEIK
jgi:1-deoxy-D-xylulose-5-phosphate reductoisomerase